MQYGATFVLSDMAETTQHTLAIDAKSDNAAITKAKKWASKILQEKNPHARTRLYVTGGDPAKPCDYTGSWEQGRYWMTM